MLGEAGCMVAMAAAQAGERLQPERGFGVGWLELMQCRVLSSAGSVAPAGPGSGVLIKPQTGRYDCEVGLLVGGTTHMRPYDMKAGMNVASNGGNACASLGAKNGQCSDQETGLSIWLRNQCYIYWQPRPGC